MASIDARKPVNMFDFLICKPYQGLVKSRKRCEYVIGVALKMTESPQDPQRYKETLLHIETQNCVFEMFVSVLYIQVIFCFCYFADVNDSLSPAALEKSINTNRRVLL